MSSYLEWKKRAIVMGSGGWWLPPNFDPADCLAAYQFKGAGSESAALTDLTGQGNTLTKTGAVTFDNAIGYTFVEGLRPVRNLNNNSIISSVKSVIIRYSDIAGGIGQMARGVIYDNMDPQDGGGSSADCGICGNFEMAWESGDEWAHWGAKIPSKPVIYDLSGIFGYNIGWMNPIDGENEGEIYFNGTVRQIQGRIGYTYRNGPLFGNNNSSYGNLGRFSIQAGAFYSRWLTASEMSYLYYQIAAI